MSQIICLRHGSYGRDDNWIDHLSDLGRVQAQEGSIRLNQLITLETNVQVYSSPLLRARQ